MFESIRIIVCVEMFRFWVWCYSIYVCPFFPVLHFLLAHQFSIWHRVAMPLSMLLFRELRLHKVQPRQFKKTLSTRQLKIQGCTSSHYVQSVCKSIHCEGSDAASRQAMLSESTGWQTGVQSPPFESLECLFAHFRTLEKSPEACGLSISSIPK